MTTLRPGTRVRITAWALTSCLLLALAACGAASTASGRPSATHLASPSTTGPALSTATVSLTTSAHWTALPNTPPGAANITFAPSNPHIGLICTGYVPSSTGQPRLYKTTDGGQSWHEVTGLPPIQIPSGSNSEILLSSCSTFIDAADSNDVFLQQIVLDPQGAGTAVARALYRSRDGGATWGEPLGTVDRTRGFDELAVLGSRLVATAHPNIYGARGFSSIDPFPPEQPSTVLYASDDGGQTWQPIGQSIESQQLAVVGMSLMGTTLVARANTLSPGGCPPSPIQPKTSLWRSSDGGQSWQQLASLSSELSMLSFTARANGTGYDGVALPVSAGSGAPVSVLFSDDSGTAWSPLPALDPNRTPITDPTKVQWDTLAVTPSGAVVAQVLQYPMPGGPSGIFTIRPGDPHPAWTLYAPAVDGESSITVVDGTTFWALDRMGGAPVLKYLSLP